MSATQKSQFQITPGVFITNTSGIVLQEIPVTLNRDQVTIPLQNLSTGNYILTLKTNKKVIESVGFNVMK